MQREDQEWHNEASKVASIYGNSVLTLAYGDIPDSSEPWRRSCQDCKEKRERVIAYMETTTGPSVPRSTEEVWENCRLKDAVQATLQPFVKGGPITDHAQGSPELLYSWLEAHQNFPTRPASEIDKRGWTFQEILLSRRVIYMTKDGFFWDCCRLSAADSRPLGLRGDFSPKFRDSN